MIDLARPGTGRIRRKTSSLTPGTTWNGPGFHGWGDLPPVEDEVDDITRPHCATWERHVFLTDWTCRRLVLTLPTVFHRGGSKPEVVVVGGSRCNGRVFSTGSHPGTHQGPHFRCAVATLENVKIESSRPSLSALGNVRQRKLLLSFLSWMPLMSQILRKYLTIYGT